MRKEGRDIQGKYLDLQVTITSLRPGKDEEGSIGKDDFYCGAPRKSQQLSQQTVLQRWSLAVSARRWELTGKSWAFAHMLCAGLRVTGVQLEVVSRLSSLLLTSFEERGIMVFGEVQIGEEAEKERQMRDRRNMKDCSKGHIENPLEYKLLNTHIHTHDGWCAHTWSNLTWRIELIPNRQAAK